MSKFKIGKRNLESENNWQDIDIEKFRITKPTVLCFGGRGTIQPRHANYLCRLAKSLVGLVEDGKECKSEDVDFVGIVHDPIFSAMQMVKGSNVSLTDKDERKIATKLLLTLCKDDCGNLLSENEIIKNFNKITFFTHCQGAVEARGVVEYAKKEMARIGFNSECVDRALGQIFAVNYAPVKNCGVPSLNVYSLKDFTLDGHISSEDEKYIPSVQFMTKTKNHPNEYGNILIRDDDQTATLLCSNMSFEHQEENYEHRITFLDRNSNWQSSVWDISTQGDRVSQIVGYALATSIASGINNTNLATFQPKHTVEELMRDFKSIMEGTENSVFEKIVGDISDNREDACTINDDRTQ